MEELCTGTYFIRRKSYQDSAIFVLSLFNFSVYIDRN